jgi:hypothetical protein
MVRMLCRRLSAVLSGLFLLILMVSFSSPGTAGDPQSAYYGAENDHLFWFIQTSDTHIGARGSADADNLNWIVTRARTIIEPSFILATGDLTDSTNGNFLGLPDGPHQAEWNEYKSIVDPAGITQDDYYDIPGNHDAYHDRYFVYYRANSVQGRATGNTQLSFVKDFAFGKYHFLGINTADNTGDPFSIFWPYGDYAGLDNSELSFIGNEMSLHSDSELTLVFGHHPLFETGNSEDTYVYYGLPQFLSFMDQYYSPLYGYGHTHAFSEAFFIPDGAAHEGFFYFNVSSLGKSSSNQYTIMAIDCNGLSSKTRTIGTWPAVLITAPVDANLGGGNPYSYSVPAAASNPIRSLVFDANTVSSVQYRIDGGTLWSNMSQVPGNQHLWQAMWDASSLPQGQHTIEVRASSASGTSNDTITVNVQQSSPLPQSAASFINVGKYVTTGSKRNKVTTFVSGTVFYQGDSVVFRLKLEDSKNLPISGATVQLSITGDGSPVTLTSAASNAAGEVETVWATSAPNKRGVGGTAVGSYSAAVTGVTAAGYTWDGVQNKTTFSILKK